MRTVLLPLGALLILVAPFREGGRDPLALLVLHSLAFACMIVSLAAGRSRWPRRPGALPAIALLLGLAVLAAGLAAARAAYPLAALLGLLDVGMAAGLFLAAAASRADGRTLAILRNVAVASTGIQACLALLRFPAGGLAAAGASFLNPNHLAAFLNLGLLLSVAAAEEAAGPAGRRPRAAAWGAVAALHLLAIALLSSRGALLGLSAALLALALLRWRSWTRVRRRAATAALAAVLAIGGTMLFLRFARTDDPYRYHRVQIWTAAAGMLAEHPFLGIGPGMFGQVSPRHNFPVERGPLRFDRTFAGAHSGVLTLAVESGIPAAGALLAAALLALAALLGWRQETAGAARIGIGLSVLALLVQGLVEDLQERTALTLVPAILLGAGLASLGSRDAGEATGEGVSAPAPRRGGRARPAARASAALVVTYFFLVAIALPYAAHRAAETARRVGREGLELMRLAARLNPIHPEYRHDLAMAALNSGPPAPERYAEAFLHLRAARRLKPVDYRFPLLLARLEAHAGERLFADGTAMERATALYREAILLAPLDPRPRLELAHHLLAMGRKEEALGATGEALSLEPNFLRARVLEASILLRLGRLDEALASEEGLEGTLRALEGFIPESGYARAIVEDAPADRERLAADLSAAGRPPQADRTR